MIQDKNEGVASDREKDACSVEVGAQRSERAGAHGGAGSLPPLSFSLRCRVASPLEVWKKDVVMKGQS